MGDDNLIIKKNEMIKISLNPKILENAPIDKTFLPHSVDFCADTIKMLNSSFPFFSKRKKGGDKIYNVTTEFKEDNVKNDKLGTLTLEPHPCPALSTEERKKIIFEKIEQKGYSPALENILKKHFMVFAAYDFDCGKTHKDFDFEFD